MSEPEIDQMIGRLVRQKHNAEVGYATLDAKIKDLGSRLENLGTKLRSVSTGGDYRDLLGFLEGAGIGTAGIADLLNERNRLWNEIAECKSRLGSLGVSGA